MSTQSTIYEDFFSLVKTPKASQHVGILIDLSCNMLTFKYICLEIMSNANVNWILKICNSNLIWLMNTSLSNKYYKFAVNNSNIQQSMHRQYVNGAIADLTKFNRAKHRNFLTDQWCSFITRQNAQRPDEIERPCGVHHVGVGRAHLPVLPLHVPLRRLPGTDDKSRWILWRFLSISNPTLFLI